MGGSGAEREPQAASERVGLLTSGLCALNGAFVPAVAKLTTDRADPAFVAVATTLFAALAAAAVLATRRELPHLVRGPKAPWLLLLGVLGTAVPYALFFQGTRRTSAIEAVLCLQVEPVYALLLAWLVLGHRLTLRRASAAALLLAGIALAVGTTAQADPLGLAALLATPLCWQVSHLVVLRRLLGVAPPLLTGARYLFGGLALAPALLVPGVAPPPADDLAQQLTWLALQGVVLSYVGTMLWYLTIARIDLGRATAIVVPSIPVLSLGASFFLVGELPSVRQAVGMLVIVAGVLAFVRAPHAVSTRERVPTATAPLALPVENPPSSGEHPPA